MAGIILQYYCPLSIRFIAIVAGIFLSTLILFKLLSPAQRFSMRWIQGLLVLLFITIIGAAITYRQDIRNNKNWIENISPDNSWLLVRLTEPLQEKERTYKAVAEITGVVKQDKLQAAAGNIILYIKKDSASKYFGYGTQLYINTSLQPISATGNPGGFDYSHYCALQNIYHQAYLQPAQYMVLPAKKVSWLQEKLFRSGNWLIDILKQVPGEKERGVAEALLIGYRYDLDKDLMQAYSNTGVVHIIAISGMHLALIYGLLLLLFAPFKKYKATRIIQPVVVIAVLFLFSLMTGGGPSIMRACVMFSVLAIGNALSRKNSIYNNLAASAFILLVYNPFYLWDVGFQLSYTAVLSIVVFQKAVCNWLYFKNKLIQSLWELTSVTLAAQILTTPVVLYHFHQFPNLVFITNIIAVPLSGLILYAELLLIPFCAWQPVASWIGWLISKGIYLMNVVIEHINAIPFAVTDSISVSAVQTWLMYLLIAYASIWLYGKKPRALIYAIATCSGITFLHTIDKWSRTRQERVVVYNVAKRNAIEIIQGQSALFIGDTAVLTDKSQYNFQIKPAHTLWRVEQGAAFPLQKNLAFTVSGKRIVFLNQPLLSRLIAEKLTADIIVVTGNPKLYIKDISAVFDCRQIVFDNTNALWKIEKWKKDCDSIHLRFHSVPQQGAFVMEL